MISRRENPRSFPVRRRFKVGHHSRTSSVKRFNAASGRRKSVSSAQQTRAWRGYGLASMSKAARRFACYFEYLANLSLPDTLPCTSFEQALAFLNILNQLGR